MPGRRAVLLALPAIFLGSGLAWAFDNLPMTVPEMAENGGLVVDIRQPEEWAETGVIAGAKLLPFDDPQSFIAALGPELSDGRDLILVCRSGRRSAAAAEALEAMIPNRIISVEGGMSLLMDQGYQTVAPE